MRDENLALTERGYELFGRGDLETMKAELFSPDVVWRTEGPGPFEPEYKGVDALFGYFGQLFEMSDGTFKAEPLHMYADDERSVAIQRVTGTRAGKHIDTTMVLVFEVHDGRVWEVTQFAAEPSKLNDFWS